MEELFKKLGIEPNSLDLYNIAFTHSSCVNEKKAQVDYERLEFLGDAVLEVVSSDYIYNHFDGKSEGEMTKLRANYVCENACFTYASELEFSNYIKVSQGEEKEGGRYKKVIVADIFEAFMGAIYLDLGFDTVRKVILEIITPYIEKNTKFHNDYKSALQEFVQTDQRTVHYELVNETGPAHDKEFTMCVKVDDILYGTGTGKTKKEAEQEAAKNALEKLAVLD